MRDKLAEDVMLHLLGERGVKVDEIPTFAYRMADAMLRQRVFQ